MSRWLALARAPENTSTPFDSSTNPDKTKPEGEIRGFVTFSRMSPREKEEIDDLVPNIEEFEERAAIAEYDGGLSREGSEELAARSQGYDNVVAFRAAIAGDDRT